MSGIEGGYVLLSRKLIESGIWGKPPIYLKVWMYILTKAQHKPYKNLDRGELLVSIPELIEVCSYKVGYRTEKPTKTQIFNVLEWLRNPSEGANEGVTNGAMIETTKTTRGIVVKVLNYNVYQDPKSYERNAVQNDEETANGTMPERQADTINKNDKNGKNEKKEDMDADASEIFEYYISKQLIIHKDFNPSRKGKVKTALKKYSVDELKKIIDNYATVAKGSQYYFDTIYSLDKLMRPKDLAQFSDEENPLHNFLRVRGQNNKTTGSKPLQVSNSVDASEMLEGMEW